MKVTIKLKQVRCVTIKIMRVHSGVQLFPTSLWFPILLFAHRARSRENCHDIDHWSERLTAAFDHASTSSAIYSGS